MQPKMPASARSGEKHQDNDPEDRRCVVIRSPVTSATCARVSFAIATARIQLLAAEKRTQMDIGQLHDPQPVQILLQSRDRDRSVRAAEIQPLDEDSIAERGGGRGKQSGAGRRPGNPRRARNVPDRERGYGSPRKRTPPPARPRASPRSAPQPVATMPVHPENTARRARTARRNPSTSRSPGTRRRRDVSAERPVDRAAPGPRSSR